jgi:muramoyltetrapeptide carboxypeptidase
MQHNKLLPRVPRKLKKGDAIGIIAPAAKLIDRDQFIGGINILREMGFEPVFPRELWPGDFYLADTDKNRVEEFSRMWSEDHIKALIAVRGGYGSIRIAPQLDKDLIQSKEKFFIGFSDITLLHMFLYNRCSMVSLHGPVLTSLWTSSQEALERFYVSLTGGALNPIPFRRIEVLREGMQESPAPLIGGNLSTIMTTIGTSLDFDYRGKVLFLEDIGEMQFRIDRMLTHLHLAGKLSGLSGLILGNFSHPDITDIVDMLRYKEFVWNRVMELTENEGYPIIADFPAGHCSTNLTLPHGADVLIDIEKKCLRF